MSTSVPLSPTSTAVSSRADSLAARIAGVLRAPRATFAALADTPRSIDVLMSRIRRKLRDGGGEDVIKTVRNGGYQCSAPVDVAGGPA